MNPLRIAVLSILTVGLAGGFFHRAPTEAKSLAQPTPVAEKRPIKKERPRVEMVFALDTTGSMSGLIEGAKQKIWGIVNEVVKGQPTPEVRIGLVAYRDKGDAYVTQVTQLTGDLDAVYKDLMAFSAGGGGDGPENVNQALHDAVHKIEWSGKEVRALRVVFLVGDAPPHMDYQDVPSYEATVREAAQRNVLVNAIRCGTWDETGRHWAKIASLGGGEYLTIDQSGGMIATTTPFDDRLAALSGELDKTYVVSGDRDSRREAEMALGAATATADAGGDYAKAERAIYRAKAGGKSAPAKAAKSDLVTLYEMDDDAVEGMLAKPEELPAEMKPMSVEERRSHVKKQSKKRKAIQKEIDELAKKRADYLAEKSTKNKDAFDEKLMDVVRVQAAAEAAVAY